MNDGFHKIMFLNQCIQSIQQRKIFLLHLRSLYFCIFLQAEQAIYSQAIADTPTLRKCMYVSITMMILMTECMCVEWVWPSRGIAHPRYNGCELYALSVKFK